MWHYLGTTYVVDLETCRVHGEYPYYLNANFRFSTNIKTLSEFELQLRNEVVNLVWRFHIEVIAGDSGGIRLKPAKATLVTKPVKLATKGAAATDTEAEDAWGDSFLGSSKIKSLISTLHEYRLLFY